MTQHAEASGEGNEFGQVPKKCCTFKREGEILVDVKKTKQKLRPHLSFCISRDAVL